MASATVNSWAAATQSWASWLLDSYADSVSPLATDTSFHHHEDSQSVSESSYHESHSSVSSVSTSSTYGPYVKTGRGGAGNFTWQQPELKLAPRSTSPVDLEANRPFQTRPPLAERRRASARLEAIDTHDLRPKRQNSAQYLAAGRGGVGNYAPSNEMKPLQRSTTLPAKLISSPTTPRPVSPKEQKSYPVQHAGRGGAGNYAAAAEVGVWAETEKDQKARLAAEQRREQIIEEVNGLLQPPPGVWLGGRRKSESLFDED